MARTSTSSGPDGTKAVQAKEAPTGKEPSAKASKAAAAKKTAPAPARPPHDAAEPAATKAAKVAAPAPAVSPSKPATKAAPAKAASGVKAPGGYSTDKEFLAVQKEALLAERATYLEQAQALRAEAESLVNEAEPGDVQFDEESGEGAGTTVDRERDLALSNQALLAVEEIGVALDKIEHGRYGVCEGCGELIPKARLEALPFARLCIACKSGGLSRR